MASEHGDDPERQVAAREAAGELSRMGIDPRALGLAAVDPAVPALRPPAPDPPPPEESTLSRPLGAPPRPAPATLLGQVAERPRVVLPTGWRRLARAVSSGLARASAAEAMREERRFVARVRSRQPAPRLIAFLAGKGGVGTTVTAAGVALTFAGLRNDSLALVCARRGAGSLGQRVLGGAGRGHDRLAVFDGAPWHTPTPPDALIRLLADLRIRHQLTLVDIGNELSETTQAALERADQIVLVTTASQDAVATARIALGRVHQVDPFRLGTVVVALTCRHRREYRRTVSRLREELALGGGRIVPVPYDPALAAGDQLDLTRTRPATREAYLRVAGLAVDPGEPETWFAPAAGTGR